LAALLEPLAQAMVAHGVTLGTATEALKKALLSAAEDSSDQPLSDSRASLLTGLHRKDVKRLRDQEGGTPEKRSSSAAALVISHWATSPDYQNMSGAPRDLHRKGDQDGPGFDDLVRLARIDMAPGTVLNMLLDQSIVEITPKGRLHLLTHAFLPSGGGAEQVAAYQATLSAHLMAATQNLLAEPGDARNFDRAVRYSHLSLESVAQLRQTSEERAQALLQDINALARTLQDRDQDGGHTGRFVIGAYVLPSPPGEADEDPEEGDTK
jgi:hypothetical protein